MSTRYEDAQNDRSRSRRDSRDLDDRPTGEGLRRDVRQTGENIRNAGGDIVSNICGLWGNLLNSVGDAVSPRTSSTRPTNDPPRGNNAPDESRSGLFSCDGAEFKVSCGSPSSGRSEGDSRDSRDERSSEEDEPTRASYEDRKRQINITT